MTLPQLLEGLTEAARLASDAKLRVSTACSADCARQLTFLGLEDRVKLVPEQLDIGRCSLLDELSEELVLMTAVFAMPTANVLRLM